MPDDFDQLSDRLVGSLRRMLRDAYDAGQIVGRREAAASMKARLSQLIDGEENQVLPLIAAAESPEVSPAPTAGVQGEEPPALKRAVQGSVKPAVAKIVADFPGLTAEEIHNRTGIKHNSVRGTLWTLTNEHVVERREGRWYPVAQKDEAAKEADAAPDAPEPDDPFDDMI